MTTTAQTASLFANPLVLPAVNGKKQHISWPDFQKKYLSREDGYKYEWVNGAVEKTRHSMDKTQLPLTPYKITFRSPGIANSSLINK